MNTETSLEGGFAATGLSPALLSLLTRDGLSEPTPIQEKAIPVAMTGADLIGVAQTGTGKTLAFALPLLERLHDGRSQALILAPTRELALQIDEVIHGLARRLRPTIYSTVVIGGASMRAQVDALHRRPRIIIATPGRLQDHLTQGTVRLSGITHLVLDEADRMLDMGFLPQIRRIVQSIPADRQTMLFSATMSAEVTVLAQDYLRSPVRIEVARPGSTIDKVEQLLCYVDKDRKPEMLTSLLDQYRGSVLVFSRTKHGAAKLSHRLVMAGYMAAEIHSDRSLSQRRSALDGFRSGRFRVLVATDIAARGIDVNDIELVVNYDLPDVAEDYVHRIGRTGRAGKSGVAITLADHDQYSDVRSIERLIERPLPLSEHSEPARAPQPAPRSSSAGRGRSGGFGRTARPSGQRASRTGGWAGFGAGRSGRW